MNRAQIGRVMIGFGVILVLVGVVGLLTGGSEDESVAAPSTQTTEPPATTPPATDSPSTTTTAQPQTTTSSSTTLPTTTTTTLPPESIDDFVVAFREALDADDLDFVFSRLHPAVIEDYGQDLCRTWTEREILALEEYQITAPYSELGETTMNLPGGAVPVDELFRVPISFVFQGQFFEDNASYAREAGVVYWLGNCR
jgi:hypothetical protein